MIRTLTGENKSTDLDPIKTNDVLLNRAVKNFHTPVKLMFFIPSDIRKPHSKQTENLGKVRSLDGYYQWLQHA